MIHAMQRTRGTVLIEVDTHQNRGFPMEQVNRCGIEVLRNNTAGGHKEDVALTLINNAQVPRK
ncbi:hypothetical protein P691DRAFT_810244 [Macrolepiota fuliginosa MF-IS2]|uniref:Uncharacterized protein n=1 Tax=Macrolepiota fuliginosa MF-IS2 TaxID=1400762 RepID=A0A9P5X295_9AGAR|nr:hypothetical protein P691DRAFT_810244 [Macrolepiota fuliginosa MF-IS2]